jgi:kynurenine formamidase
MKHIDVTVPLDARPATDPTNTPFTLEPITRLARGDSSNVASLHMSAHTGTHVLLSQP